MKIRHILLVTGNSGKAKEFKKLLDLPDIRISYKALSLLEVQHKDIKEIGRIKTLSALRQSYKSLQPDAILTDDTGLYCKGLGGLPGVMVKWFLSSLSAEGLFRLVENNNRSTRATCLLSLGVVDTDEIHSFQGSIDGNLVAPRGRFGFGWDSIFQPKGSSKTYGEMESLEKNMVSHRMKAVQELRKWLIEVSNKG